METTTMLPPSFGGDGLVYGLSLSGLLMVVFGALAMLVHIGRSGPIQKGWGTPSSHFYIGYALYFVTVLLGAAPDAVFMVLYNEVPYSTILYINKVDRLCDGLTVIPFLASIVLLLRGEPAMRVQLSLKVPIPFQLYVEWPLIRRQMYILGLSAILAVGITLGKLSGHG